MFVRTFSRTCAVMRTCTVSKFVNRDDAGASSAGSVIACNADTVQCANVADVDDIDTVVLPRL